MKNTLLGFFRFIRQNQAGLFKVAILVILLYWTLLFQVIAENSMLLSDVADELSAVSGKIGDVESRLSDLDYTLSSR